ncbi:MAG: putative lipid II flippase FtsW [Gammaproteobacteria bacterium]
MSRARSNSWALHLDPLFLLIVSGLLIIGLIMMTSASVPGAERTYGTPFFYLQRQTVFLLIGLAASGVVLLIPTSVWERTSFFALMLTFLLLIVVLIPGVTREINGAHRWIDLGFMNLQVSEVTRVLMFFYICSYAVRHSEAMRESMMGFARPMMFVVLACGLLLGQPDFGAAAVLLATTLVLMFLGGVRLRDCALAFVLACAGLAAVIASATYRVERLMGFLFPFENAADSGFQLTQSLVAIGRGEIYGVGLGASVQKLFFLPEARTDFVFAVLAEETGLIGVTITVVIFFALVARGFAIARRAARHKLMFQAYLAYILSSWFGLQAFINMGVNAGLLPTKGLTLPFISYGGSSLLSTLVSAALILRVYHETQAVEAKALSDVRANSRGPMQ